MERTRLRELSLFDPGKNHSPRRSGNGENSFKRIVTTPPINGYALNTVVEMERTRLRELSHFYS